MFPSLRRTTRRSKRSRSIQFLAAALISTVAIVSAAHAQSGGGIDFTGTNGQHTIQGRIFFPSGRNADSRLKVRLESSNTGGLSVLADLNGAFSFRGLAPGSYSVMVEAGDEYETTRESVYIDTEVRSRAMRMPTVRRSYSVPIYLRLKSGAAGAKPGVLNASLAGVPKSAADQYGRALEAARTGDSAKAVELLKSAVASYPEFALALNELGVQYLKLGQADKAAEALRSALRIVPDAFTPRLNYGIALLNRKEFAEAESQLRQALKKNDSSPTAHLYLGITLINLRKYNEAEKHLQRTIDVSGDGISLAHYYLGGIYWSKGEHKRAADELEKYLKLAPKAPDAERIRGTIKELRSKQ